MPQNQQLAFLQNCESDEFLGKIEKLQHFPLHRLFECDQNVALDVAAAASKAGILRRLGLLPLEVAKAAEPPANTEKLFKEIAETGAVEPELKALVAARAALALTVPAWRRRGAFLPSGAKLVILATVVCINSREGNLIFLSNLKKARMAIS